MKSIFFVVYACLNLSNGLLSGTMSKTRVPSINLARTPSSVVESYFSHWNDRDMNAACALFDDECIYEDTLYPKVFTGKDSLRSHLLNVASSVPNSFRFIVDDICESKNKVSVKWHVEANGQELPFTRGLSLYTLNKNGLIVTGFDIPEPTIKAGSFSLGLLKYAKIITSEPKRLLPLLLWVLYCWLLFVSDIAPGVNAFQLDPKTWTEVKDLSVNFWLVLPVLSPTSAPIVHPMLEGLFNIILAWSGLFAGFLIDGVDKRSKPHVNNFLPVVAGMQFLTNAILLPYLVTREGAGDQGRVLIENQCPLTTVEKIGESKLLPVVLGGIGTVAAYWALNGRLEDFGSVSARWESFKNILLNDRLTFSFVIDALYFTLFQGWLIDDDIAKRTEPASLEKQQFLVSTGKYVPFFGLVAYLFLRPSIAADKSMKL